MGHRLTRGAAVFLAELVAAADAGDVVHVMRHPAGVLGAAVTPRTYRRLRRELLVEVGPFVPGLGRPVVATAAGRAALAAYGRPRPQRPAIIDDQETPA